MSAPSDGVHPPAGSSPRSESRGIHRLPIRLAVSRRGRSAPLGTTRDISLRGAFIETQAPLPIGTAVPLSIDLAASEPPLELRGEVVRVTTEGMGLQFDTGERGAVKRLKKWIIDRTSVQGTQRQVEQLHDQSRTIEPIRAAPRIRALLERIRETDTPVLLIPIDRLARDRARLVAIAGDGLRLTTADPTTIQPGDEVYALAQLGYDAYSFGLHVREAHGSTLVAELPDHVVYSERRTKDRTPVEPGTMVRWPAPWDPAASIERPVLERSAEGLSFRVAESECLLVPGAPLADATLSLHGHEEPLVGAEVRHITRVVDPDGSAWLRVGVSYGMQHEAVRVEAAEARQPGMRGPLGWLRRIFGKARTAISYGFHKGRERLVDRPADTRRVTIPGDPHPIVALLDRTAGFGATTGRARKPGRAGRSTGGSDERLRAPLVIVVPGFAGRKEQMGFFAGTLVEGFERQHQDVAVLRFDASNNIGESGGDPECAGEGLQALHFTLTGQVKDILAVLAWARKNPLVDPTQIILVSVSMGSVGVRHVMTKPEAADVGLWISYMGAPDAIDPIRLVSGNIDLYEYWKRGQKVGIVSCNGVLIDGDHFWADLHKLGIGDLTASVREMTNVRADVVWLYGLHDAFMDPRRVREAMSAPHPSGARRELVEVDGGHLPRTGDEAVAQFVRLTRRVWQHLHHSQMEPFTPSVGRLAARSEAEWKSVRRTRLPDRSAWWKGYLLDPEGLGFDVLEHSAEYRRFMDREAELLADVDGRVLDLGAGTGNLSLRLLASAASRQSSTRIVAADLVPEALEALRAKAAVTHPDDLERLALQPVDAEGSPLIALRRFVVGDLAGPHELAERLPGVSRPALDELLRHHSDGVMAAMRGHEVSVEPLARALKLSAGAEALLTDLQILTRFVRGRIHAAVAGPTLSRLPASILDTSRGLPFPDGSFDAVAMSLFVSYLDHPDDVLAEAWRVLRPGGRLLVSSLLPDYDLSKVFVSTVEHFERLPDAELPPGWPREKLLASARHFVDHASELFRLAEEGLFRLHDATALLALVRSRGFVDATTELVFGDPPQAVIVTCRRA